MREERYRKTTGTRVGGEIRERRPSDNIVRGSYFAPAEDYLVERDTNGWYDVYSPTGKRLGSTLTLWGAKHLIRKDKNGKGPGTIAYTEKA